MPLTKTKPPKLDAQTALNEAIAWAVQCQTGEHYGRPITGSDYALISIAASLRELVAKR